MNRPDLTMCWDGETPEAELGVDLYTFRGDPYEVEEAFHALVKLRDRAEAAERRLEKLKTALAKASREAGL